MSEQGPEVLEAYTEALGSFLNGGGERVLEDAYLIGRRFAAEGGGVVELGEVHRRALRAVLPTAAERRGCVDAAALATRFLAEASSSFEMILRGYRDTTAALKELNGTLEARVAERTRELEEAQARNIQAQKEETIGRLVGGITHDFNNLLSVILACSDLALSKVGSDDQARDDLLGAREAATRASDLTRQLLAFSRRQVLEPRVIDLSDTVRNMEQMLRRLIRSDIELESRLAPDLASVRADPVQIEQVIVNLVVNAKDAIQGAGVITLTTENVDSAELEEAAEEAGGEAPEPAGPGSPGSVRFSVTDTGKGMDEEVLSRLFEPFYTTKEEGHGTGLGLPTCQGIVHQTGGFIRVQSRPGAGSRFEVYLPATTETLSAGRAGERADENRREGTSTILVVDDNDSLRRVIARVLESRGFRVFGAASSADALEVLSARGDDIDLLLADVMLPGMRGPELLAVARSRWPHLRALVTTGYAAAEIRETIEGLPVLHKPFGTQELLAAVTTAMTAWEEMDEA